MQAQDEHDAIEEAAWARWEAYETAKGRSTRMQLGWPVERPRQFSEDRLGELAVEHDDAALHYDGRQYHLKMSRRLHNGIQAAITRYLIRISVDRYPGDPGRSNEHYRRNPLTFEELGLKAWCADEPMVWEPKLDRDSFKEAWLLFENDGAKFPLYSDQRTWIHYSYSISDDKWGRWFQRAVRLPTHRLSVRLAFPAALQATVWGTETSLTADQMPLRTPLQRTEMDDLAVFDWSTEHPALNVRYRFEWKFRARPEAD